MEGGEETLVWTEEVAAVGVVRCDCGEDSLEALTTPEGEPPLVRANEPS